MRITVVVVLLFISSITLGQKATKPLMISHLTKDFYIYTTYGNPGNGTKYPANGMYLVTNQGVVIFDTPWDVSQFQPLLDSIEARHHKKVILCLATHFHEDRTAGLAYYKQKGIKTYTTKLTDQLLKEKKQKRAAYLIDKDTIFSVGQYHFQTIYPGQGHSTDNIVIWFPSEKILYGGCFIKSVLADSPGNLSDANIDEWIKSIQKLQSAIGVPNFIIPGHQDWTSQKSVTHTMQLLKKYRKSLKS